MKESLTVFLFFNIVAISFLQAHPAGPPGTFSALNPDGCHEDRGKMHCHEKGSPAKRWFRYNEGRKFHSIADYREQFCEANEGKIGNYVRNVQDAVNSTLR